MSETGQMFAEETTLVSDSQTNKQTNTNTPNIEEKHLKYLSVRVTVRHNNVRELLKNVFGDTDYICYKHTGFKTKKEHVHILVPDLSIAQKLRTRLLRAGYKGNESFSIKSFTNGLSKGIQYASKEGTVPDYIGEFEDDIKNAPKWEYKTEPNMHNYYGSSDKPDVKLRDWNLNYSNLVPQAVRYAKVNKMGNSTLKEVVKDMLKHTKWRPCKAMIIGGVPDFYMHDFMYRMGQKTEPDMSWFCQRN